MNKRNITIAGYVTIFILFLIIALLPCYLHHLSENELSFYSKTGVIGDTYGGILGPLIGLIGAILTFLAFYAQYEANETQKQEIAKQRESWIIDRFENRFFELVKLHKENINEIELDTGTHGRKSFEKMFSEFEAIHSKVIIARRKIKDANKDVSKFNELYLAYGIFFHGMGSNPLLTSLLKEPEIAREIYDCLENDLLNTNGNQIGPHEEYSGHSNSLGHYYRHLLQTVKFVINHEEIKLEMKQEYMNLLRAQLSNYEQLMLYINAIAWFPDKWHTAFIDYKLIRNLPFELADSLEPQNWPLIKYNKEIITLAEKGEVLFENQPSIEVIKGYSDYQPEYK